MIKYTLNNNGILNYIPIEPQKPVFGFFPREDAAQRTLRDHNYNGVDNIPNTQSCDSEPDINLAINAGFTIPMSYKYYQPGYMGATTQVIPHIIDSNKADFKTFYLSEDLDLSSYNNPSNVESWLTDLFVSNDNFKIATLFNGLQFLKLPINCFNDIVVSPIAPKYGLHYIKIAPKYIDVPVVNIIPREQINLLYPSFTLLRQYGFRQVIEVNKTNLTGTVWAFENLSSVYQRGRLSGSIVEVWNSTKSIKKQSKIIVEDDYYNNNSASTSALILSPDTVGYDAPSQVVTPGDVLRIYPRESYFTPLFIEVTYQGLTNDLTAMVRFMKNDAARDLTNNVYEIYDDNGITIDSNGNLDGEVIMSYQIVKVGQKEIRKRIS